MNATLSATNPSQPLAGRSVRFETASGTLLCAATTDATGRATCGTLATYVTTIANRGYYARFAGDGAYSAASAFGYLVGNE
jgi:hypothetical protein